MPLEIDHLIVCVSDLGPSVAAFESAHRLVSVGGGQHQGHGTANRLIPLGNSYIELVAVVDTVEAQGSAFGTWVAEHSTRPGADAIAIRTDDLDSVCERLSLEPLTMSRTNSAGAELRWRIAGMEHLVSAGLPFFIEWDIEPDLHPGRAEVVHPRGETRLGEVVVSGDRDRLQRWTAGVGDVSVESGPVGARFELVDGRL